MESDRQANLRALQIYQPESWSALRDLAESPFELDAGQICWQGRRWSLAAPLPDLPEHLSGSPAAVLIYGMGDGGWVRSLRARLGPLTPLIVLDSLPELAWACLGVSGLEDLIADPGLQWLVAPGEALLGRLAEARLALQDQLGVLWLRQAGLAEVASLSEDPFVAAYLQLAEHFNGRSPMTSLPRLEALYADLEPEMTRAYASYPLSCRSGCADCCQGSVGFHLCINPLEWALLHRQLLGLDSAKRHRVFVRCVETLARHQDFLVELLHYFDAQPERLQEPAFHLELLRMAGEQRQDPCVLLGPDLACEVYAGRPFTCRVFGNSQVEGRQAFTCGKDHAQMEQILLDEGSASALVDSSAYREQLWALHTEQPFKQVLHLWLLTHLDLAAGDFKPLRLDYQQFQALVRHPQVLDDLLAQLQTAARSNR